MHRTKGMFDDGIEHVCPDDEVDLHAPIKSCICDPTFQQDVIPGFGIFGVMRWYQHNKLRPDDIFPENWSGDA